MLNKNCLSLESPVQYLKGIGPKRARCLEKIGVATVRDLLYLLPRRYLDYTAIRCIRDLRIDDDTTVIGRVTMTEHRATRHRTSLTTLLVADDTGSVVVRWFNRPDLKKKFKTGDWLLLSGPVSYYRRLQFVNPLYEILTPDDLEERKAGAIIPIYPLTEGLTIWDVRRAMRRILEQLPANLPETVPEFLRQRRGLTTLTEALRNLHFPGTMVDAGRARCRLVYDEFLRFELVVTRRRTRLAREPGLVQRETGQITSAFFQTLPFVFTDEQNRVLKEIRADMARAVPMNRLLQGDVGSGKTVVALYACLIAAENGNQAAFMAPTEILAEQHYLVHADRLRRIGATPVLLTGSLRREERNEVLKKIVHGEAVIVIGTHALIEGDIMFKKLGLVVIDEQHRFGVMQRAALVNKGVNPDFLVLSATPIPRTLALTLYGDLDVSTLAEKPPGRGSVITRLVRNSEQKKVYDFIRGGIADGRQAFIICPIIETSEKVDLKSVQEAYQEVRDEFPGYKCAVIHGRLKTQERMAIMDSFRAGRIQILVATTVIEVGVDIPNATIMIIRHPERFGLAQLHQLRGRIGRGEEKAHCFLFLDRFVNPDAFARLRFFEQHNDGFALARMDMKLRGTGEILGQRQHGLPDIVIGDLEQDQELLLAARDDAAEIIRTDPELAQSRHQPLKILLGSYAQREELLRIG